MPYFNAPRAPVDQQHPEPSAICDRCDFRWLMKDLTWQFDWRGNELANLRLLVCPICLDVPFPFNRPILVGPDPIPVKNARPGQLAAQSAETQPVSGRQIIGE